MRYTERTLDALGQEYRTDKHLRWLRFLRRFFITALIGSVAYTLIGEPVEGVISAAIDLALVVTLTRLKDRRQKKIRSKYLL